MTFRRVFVCLVLATGRDCPVKIWSFLDMKRFKNRMLARRISALLSAGVLLQAAQCTPELQSLQTSLIGSIASVFVTGFVFDQLGVAQSPFGF